MSESDSEQGQDRPNVQGSEYELNAMTLEVVESEVNNGRSIRRKGIFLLPNLFTTAALFAGFYAIIAAMQGFIEQACLATFVAMAFDGMDGRVARLTHTQSAFGAEYDSLSDLVAFGLAPGLIAYSFVLSQFGKAGWMFAFIYAACTALRLARFNVQAADSDNAFFTGLPCPAAAGWIAATIWYMVDRGYTGFFVDAIVVFCVVVSACLMVANVQFRSFKDLDLRGRVPFVVILIVVLVLGVLSIDPPVLLSLIGLAYAASGPFEALYRRYR